MPLLYGEGEKAFQRLQEEIIKTNNDDSILAWELRPGNRTDKQNLVRLLAPSPANFWFHAHCIGRCPAPDHPNKWRNKHRLSKPMSLRGVQSFLDQMHDRFNSLTLKGPTAQIFRRHRQKRVAGEELRMSNTGLVIPVYIDPWKSRQQDPTLLKYSFQHSSEGLPALAQLKCAVTSQQRAGGQWIGSTLDRVALHIQVGIRPDNRATYALPTEMHPDPISGQGVRTDYRRLALVPVVCKEHAPLSTAPTASLTIRNGSTNQDIHYLNVPSLPERSLGFKIELAGEVTLEYSITSACPRTDWIEKSSTLYLPVSWRGHKKPSATLELRAEGRRFAVRLGVRFGGLFQGYNPGNQLCYSCGLKTLSYISGSAWDQRSVCDGWRTTAGEPRQMIQIDETKYLEVTTTLEGLSKNISAGSTIHVLLRYVMR